VHGLLTWPAGRPRVLVTDGWLANAGDAAIALAVDRLVRTAAPGAAVLFAAYQHELCAADCPGLALVPPLDALLGISIAPRHAPLDAGSAEALVRGADLVVSQGGGFLLERYLPWSRLQALAAVADLGLPLAIVGQTIGRFDDAKARRLLGHALRAARLVAVRDRGSLVGVADLGIDPSAVLVGSDLTLCLLDGPVDGDRAGIGVVVTGGVAVTSAAADLVAAEVLHDVLALTADEVVRVFSSAQGVEGPGIEDDRPIAGSAIGTLGDTERARVVHVEHHVGPWELLATVASCRAVVSMRLHPALLAMAVGTPAALLSEAAKVGALDGAEVPICRQPAAKSCRADAIRAALDPRAPAGPALWDALAEPRARAGRTADALIRLVAEIAG